MAEDERVAWMGRLLAALHAGGPLAFAYRRSAATLCGLDGFTPGDEGWSGEPEVGVARSRHQRAGVHRVGGLRDGDVGLVGGVRCLRARRTLIDLGAVADADLVERAVECAGRRGVVVEAELRDFAAMRYRQGHLPSARSWTAGLLGRRGPGAMPRLGSSRYAARRIPDPVRQHPLGRLRLDTAWPLWMVAAEIDGVAVHGPERLGADLRRQNRIVLGRWTLVRFTWGDVVLRPTYVVGVMRAALEAAGAPLPRLR